MADAWRNWAGDQVCRPAELVRPRDRDELAAAQSPRPRPPGGTVSVAGSGHSFTEAAMTDGTMIDVGALSGVIDADPAARAWSRSAAAPCSPTSTRSCTGSGWRWRTSATSTARRSPARSRPAPTAPARGCATSPPRSRRSSWSSPTAACRELDAPTRDLLRAARVGIGALGAISAVTLRCVPAFTLDRVDSPHPREEVLDSFEERADAHDHFELFTFPYADSALVLERNRTDGPPQPARPGRRLPQRRRARELGAGGDLGRRQAVPGGDPAPLAARRARSPRAAGRSIAATASSPTSAASASPRWSTACRASTGPRRRGG